MQQEERTGIFSSTKRIYHGSDKIIECSKFELGRQNNDYGPGFYCTEDIDRAREWAAGHSVNQCFVNKYDLNLDGLRILNFRDSQYNILHWITKLLEHRKFSVDDLELAEDSVLYLINKYHIDLQNFDVAIGYRADDSHFSYAKTFVSGAFSVEGLRRALVLGKLGEQIVLISQTAYNRIKFLEYEHVSHEKYAKVYAKRDDDARMAYRVLMRQDRTLHSGDTHYISTDNARRLEC